MQTMEIESTFSLDSVQTDLRDVMQAVAARESRTQSDAYHRGLQEAAAVYARAISPNATRTDMRVFRESLGQAEFASYFSDIIDRGTFARYQAWVPDWRKYVKIGTFGDLLRNKRRTQWGGGNQVLGRVGENGPYPQRGIEPRDFEWKGYKYGADFAASWEFILADDFDELRNLPDIMASAARNSEAFHATSLHVQSTGPNSTLYSVQNGNLGTAPLTIEALQAAITAMTQHRDPVSGVPIFNRPKYLVVPPALELVAMEILQSLTMAYAATAASAVPLPTVNVVAKFGLEIVVNPWLPLIDSTSGDTAWYLFSDPNSNPLTGAGGLAAIELDFLRGLSGPLLLVKKAQFQQVGGGEDPRGPLSDMDVASWRVIHPLGGARLFHEATYASTGAGS